jgi:hypothetical protein
MRRGCSAAELSRGAIGDVALARTGAPLDARVLRSIRYGRHSANTVAAMRAASRPEKNTTPPPAGVCRARPAPSGTFAQWFKLSPTRGSPLLRPPSSSPPGLASPEAYHLVKAYSAAARRTKRFRHGSGAMPLLRSELSLPPTVSSPGALARPARRAGLSPNECLRQQAATTRHIILMDATVLRFDNRDNLGIARRYPIPPRRGGDHYVWV